jgi:hypothetical protein
MNYRLMGAGVSMFLCSATLGSWLRPATAALPPPPAASAGAATPFTGNANTAEKSPEVAEEEEEVEEEENDEKKQTSAEQWVDRPEADVENWTSADVKQWLRSIGLPQYQSAVDKCQLQGKALLDMQHSQVCVV